MRILYNIFLIFITLVLLESCNKEEFSTNPSDTLEFSIDTVKFDTIFSQKGSITRSFKVYNRNKGIVTIDEIFVTQQDALEYFINVNGQSSTYLKNIEIQPGDSIFIFVQAKLNENSVDTAILHEDKLRFSYNTISSDVVIHAWGQDVNNYKGTELSTTTFTANKPYVIYDSLVVKQGEILTIEEGAKLYFHYNANLKVYGTLKIQGSKDKPVTFTSDRLENSYQLLPGQWGSIIFSNTSTNNTIDYAIIKNGINGLLIQSNLTSMVTVDVSNSKIYNMSSNILYAQNADLTLYNNVFANCNNYILALQGGKCTSVHNTISNDGTIGGRNVESSILITDYNLSTNSKIPLTNAYFYNSIIIGQIANEISILSEHSTVPLECKFDKCLLKDTYVASDAGYYGANIFYDSEKNLFANKANFNYSLDTLSQAKNFGKLEYANPYPNDIQGNSRIVDTKPDVGAYEYIYVDEE